MSHPQQQEFISHIRKLFPQFFSNKRVLEIGSLDINGAVRGNFTECDYAGMDLGPGPGVDIVCQAQNYDGPSESFDVVICCEVMEHNPYWKETFAQMIRVCRPGGLIVMTCASLGRPEHGTTRTNKAAAPLVPWEYYKNLKVGDFRPEFEFQKHFSCYMFIYNFDFCDLYFVGFKSGSPAPFGARRAIMHLRRRYNIANFFNLPALRRQVLVRVFGEERYWAGPIRLWSAGSRRH